MFRTVDALRVYDLPKVMTNGTFGTPNTSGVLQCIPLAPRMTGVTATYKF